MRSTCIVLLAVLGSGLVSACGDERQAAPRIELPVVTACGDVPAGPYVVAVRVNADSEIFVANRNTPVSLPTLKQHLIERQESFGSAGRYPGKAPGWGNSKMELVFEADASAAWAAVGWVMQVAGDPHILAHRFHFRVRLQGEKDGAFAYIAPIAGPMSARMPFPDYDHEMVVTLSDGGPGSHLTQLSATLGNYTSDRRARTLFHVELDDESTTITVQQMLSVLDLLRRNGGSQFTWLPAFRAPYRCHVLDWIQAPRGGEADLLAAQRVWIAEHTQPPRPLSIDVDRERLSAREVAAPLHRPDRNRGPYGWTDGTVFAWEEIISDEDLEDGPFGDPETLKGDDKDCR